MGGEEDGSTWGSQEMEDGSEISWLESETAIIGIGEGVVTANPLEIVSSSEHAEIDIGEGVVTANPLAIVSSSGHAETDD